MIIKIRKELARSIGFDKLAKFGASESGWAYRDQRDLDLATLSKGRLVQLEAILTEQITLHGADRLPGAANNRYLVQVWQRALDGKNVPKAKNASQMASFLKLLLDKVPGHRIYSQRNEIWLAYYVDRVIL